MLFVRQHDLLNSRQMHQDGIHMCVVLAESTNSQDGSYVVVGWRVEVITDTCICDEIQFCRRDLTQLFPLDPKKPAPEMIDPFVHVVSHPPWEGDESTTVTHEPHGSVGFEV